MSAYYLIFLFFTFRVSAEELSASSYQSQAVVNHLSSNETWLSLLHFVDGHSELDGDLFFYSPDGKQDAGKELQVDIEKLIDTRKQPEAENFYCQMPARSQFLVEQLKMPKAEFVNIKCPKYDQWRKDLAAKEISIVFATAGMNDPGSLFGHTFLKISSSRKTKEQDLLSFSIDFSAATGKDEGISYIVKGLFGFYNGYFSLLSYHLKSKDYLTLESRGLWEYPLKLTEKEKDFYVLHLIELEKTSAAYYFLSKNCSYQILVSLDILRPQTQFRESFIYHVIPSVTIQKLKAAGLIDQGIYHPSLMQRFQTREENLTWQERFELKHNISGQKNKELSPREEARVLDTELLYWQLQEFEGTKVDEEKFYTLKQRRASLGTQNTFSGTEGVPESDPLLGHKSARIGLTEGVFAKKTFTELDLRPAYHDILSSEKGFMPYGQLELLAARIRYLQSEKTLQLKSFLIADIFSGLLWDTYFHQTSLRVEAGLTNRSDKNHWANSLYVNGGKGIGLGLTKNIYLFPFLEVYAATRPETREDYQAGVATSVYLAGRVSDSLRLLAGTKRIWFLAGHQESIWDGSLAFSYNPAKDHEFRIYGENSYEKELGFTYLYYY